MTYVVKTSGAGGLLVADYRCPEHGLFEATVRRDENGDAPDTQPCPHVIDHDDEGGVDECLLESPWTISSPKPRVLSVLPSAAIRGGDMKDRPPHMLDTRALAEGMPLSTWKTKQRELTRDRRHKMLIDKGIKKRKIQVGG